MGKEIVLAADLGGTNLRMAAIDCHGTILYRTRREIARGSSAEEILGQIVESAVECRTGIGDSRPVKGICAAIPGTIDFGAGVITVAPNLPALNNFKMVAALESELGIKAILENDANAAALGESWCGASKDHASSILVTLGTGVGGGIIIDGRIVRGANAMAGEIGHVCVEAFGVNCRCGSVGCVEQYSSASAIVRMAGELIKQYPASSLKDIELPTASDIFEAGTNGDELALEVFRQMGFYLGVALSSLLNVLDPEIIVISGGASAGWSLFMPRTQETIRQKAFGNISKNTVIVRGGLGDDAGLLGGARLVLNSF